MKNLGILYAVFLGSFLAIGGFFLSYLFRKRKREENTYYHRSLRWFFFMFAMIWISTPVTGFYKWMEKPEVGGMLYTFIGGPFTYLHLVPAFYYFGWSFFPDKKLIRYLFIGIFTLISISALLAFWVYGFERPEIGFWGANQIPNKLASNILTFGLSLPGFLCILAELIKRYRKWKKTKDLQEKRLFGYAVGFLIYAVGGIFDALGSQDWIPLFSRGVLLISLLIFYISYSTEE